VANPVVTPPAKLELPVEVIGADVNGQQFLESTRTLTIHRAGISILLACNLAPDSEVIVRNPETNEEAIAVVVGQTPGDAAGHIYGLAFLDHKLFAARSNNCMCHLLYPLRRRNSPRKSRVL